MRIRRTNISNHRQDIMKSIYVVLVLASVLFQSTDALSPLPETTVPPIPTTIPPPTTTPPPPTTPYITTTPPWTTVPPPTTMRPPYPTIYPPRPHYVSSYVIIAPAAIRPNMRFRVGINVRKTSVWCNIVVSIKAGTTTIVSGKGSFRRGNNGRITMKIPKELQHSSYSIEIKSTGGMTFTQKRTLMFKTKRMSLYIQTDKGIYKPGDKVHFRAFGLFPSLIAFGGNFDIYIRDANNNVIRRWLNQASPLGVVVKEIELSSRPVLGEWKITVSTEKESVSKTFKVAEYVLPKFEVSVLMPSYVLITQKDIKFTVTAKYTFGKPLCGTLDVYLKLIYPYQTFVEPHTSEPFLHIQVPMEDGLTEITVPMSKLEAVTKYLHGRKLSVSALVTEKLTGNVQNSTGEVQIYSRGSKLEFPKINPTTFKPGLDYSAYLKVSQPDGLPIALSDKKVTVTVRLTMLTEVEPIWDDTEQRWYTHPPQTTYEMLEPIKLSVPENGLVIVPVPSNGKASQIYVQATYDSSHASLSLSKSHSPSNSYIQILMNTKMGIKAGDDIEFELRSTQALGTLNYQIMSRGEIIYTGSLLGNNQKQYMFSLRAISYMAPTARLIVYYVRSNGEIVTDSITFDVSGAFRNQMSMELSDNYVEPGHEIRVNIKADPGSHAFLLAIDQSVLLLASGNDVTANEVYDSLDEFDYSFKGAVGPRPVPFFLGGVGGAVIREDIIRPPYPIYYGGSDASKIFQNAGVIVITDAEVYKYVPPRYDMMFMHPEVVHKVVEAQADAGAAPGAAGALKQVDRVRSNFPETWLWTEVRTCASGKATVIATVPDTITSWIASGFAVNAATGFGMPYAPSALRVFKRFFISLNLPYSVIMGEQIAIQIIIFNYMEGDQNVRVTLESSPSFKSLYIDCNGVEYTMQKDQVATVLVKAGQTGSVFFPIIPVMLGNADITVRAQSLQAADAVRRQLLVEPPGVAMDYNIPVLIDLTSKHTSFSKAVQIDLPDNTVPGSELVKVSAIGDLMGPSIAGLDKLLRMPTGCGEQTMIGLAPDVYITGYLKITNQLSGEIKDKALTFMERGYQNELTYKHADGSYSAFTSDKSGSMWLTAFVARVFKEASNYIFVDEDVIKAAIKWIVGKQNEDGSFPEPGRVIHKEMQGQAASGVSLSAFVFISLLENDDLFANTSEWHTKVENAKARCLAYLEDQVSQSDDLYLLTLSVYAFELAESNQTDALLERLIQKANTTDGLVHWHLEETQKAKIGPWRRPNHARAVDVEMTSYVLMTYALRKDIASGRKILQWVTQQRNPDGGFSSTQDTVVGLNALSLFAEMVYSDFFDINIHCKLDTGETYNFKINQHNALLTQRRETKKIPNEVIVEATGRGLALVEIAVFFNVEEEIEDVTFDLNVTIHNETKYHLFVETCSSWLGSGNASGMAVQEVGIPSGFVPDLDSIPEMEVLRKIETEDKKLILYFDEITTEALCISFKFDRVGLVARSKPSYIKVYDYYEPSNQITVFYQSSILRETNICDICPDCVSCNTDKEGPPEEEAGVTPIDEDKQIEMELNKNSNDM